MNNTLVLVKTQVRNLYNISSFRHEPNRKKKNQQIIMLILYGFLVFVMISYSYGIALGLYFLKEVHLIPVVGFFVSAVVNLIFTISKSSSLLFSMNDYQILMALPIREKQLVNSRIIILYLSNLAFTLLIMVPMALVYYPIGKVSLVGMPIYIAGVLIAGLIPTVLASIIGGIITFISLRTRVIKYISTVLGFGAMALLFTYYIKLCSSSGSENIGSSQIAAVVVRVKEMVFDIFPPTRMFYLAISEVNYFWAALLVLGTLVVYFGYVLLLSKFYKRIITSLTSFRTKGNFKMKDQKVAKVWMAILRKERKRFFNSNIYMLNMGLGFVFLPIISAFGVKYGPVDIAQQIGLGNVDSYLFLGLPWAFVSILAMSNTAAVSLSLEGKNAWILQSMPVRNQDIFWGKSSLFFFLSIPSILIFETVYVVFFTHNILYILASLCTIGIGVLFIPTWGLWINRIFLNLDWENEVQVIKQGAASFFGLMGGMTFLGMGLGLSILFAYLNLMYLQVVVYGIFIGTGILMWKNFVGQKKLLQ